MPLSFAGPVECRRLTGLAGVTLIGRTSEGEALHASLIGAVPEELPPSLEGAELERVDAERYRLSSGALAWTFSARLYLHRDLATAFYRAVPPRPVPLLRRLIWRLALAAARTRLAQRWLAGSRG